MKVKKLGFPPNNIQIWDTTSKGLHLAGDCIKNATETFFNNRAQGVTGSSSLFNLDTSKLTTNDIQQSLQEINAGNYRIYPVDGDGQIKPFVEAATGAPYVRGAAYYMLTKKELVQSNKKICIRERASNKLYGGDNARRLLNLPLNQNIDVRPDTNALFDIFVESTSVNRKILAGTSVLVFTTA